MLLSAPQPAKGEPSSSVAAPGLRFHPAVANLAISFLLLLASVHCVEAIFYDNVTYISLEGYASGTDHQPYQGRVGMMPLLRLARNSSALAAAAAYLDRRERVEMGRTRVPPAEKMTPLKLVCVLTGALCTVGVVAMLSLYGERRYRNFWWLPAGVFLAMLYASMAARYLQALWFPYDLPHMFLFGAACVCILTGRYRLLLLLFALDVPFRETSIYLVLLSLGLYPRYLKLRPLVAMASLMLIVWLAIRLPIAHHYSHAVSETGNRVRANLGNLRPLYWPQIASACGFLLLPVWLGRRFLSRESHRFLMLCLPCFAVTAFYGLWIESRIALEFTVPLALFASEELVSAMRAVSDDEHR